MRNAPSGAIPEMQNPQFQNNLGAKALTIMKERLRSRAGTMAGSAGTLFDSMLTHYGMDQKTGRGLGGAFSSSRNVDPAGSEAVRSFLSGLHWTSQDFGTKEKEFKYGALILEDRIKAAQDQVQKQRDIESGKLPRPDGYTLATEDWYQKQSARIDLLTKQKEASTGFAGLMDLSGQVYEGKAGAFTDMIGSLQKAIELKQSLGGTFASQAGAAQAASAQVGLTTAMQGDLIPALAESGRASQELGYNFNLAGMGEDQAKAWQNYFDSRLAAQEKGKTFDDNKWAQENASDALKTIIAPSVPKNFEGMVSQRWTGAAPQGEGGMTIAQDMIDRVDSSGKVFLKRDTQTGFSPERQKMQDLLNRSDVSYSWQGSDKGKSLIVNTKSPEALRALNPNKDQAMVNFGLAARDTNSELMDYGVGGFSFREVEDPYQRAMKSQKMAWGAPELHRFDEGMIASQRALDEMRAAKKQGYDPTKNETIDEFNVRKDQERTTVVRR